MICMCRGSSFSISDTGHFSSASGNTVWFVNENTYATRLRSVRKRAPDRHADCIDVEPITALLRQDVQLRKRVAICGLLAWQLYTVFQT